MMFSLDFFAALRRMKAGAADAPLPRPPDPDKPRPVATGRSPSAIGPAGLALIKQFEGCAKKRKDARFEAYPDPGTGSDPWTIGWGATGKGIGPATIWTQPECDARLARDLARFAREVARALGDARTSQAQFDAMVSFHYNTGAIAKATLTRLHKAARFDEAAQEFSKWVHAGGRPMNGLIRRRAAEAALYRKG